VFNPPPSSRAYAHTQPSQADTKKTGQDKKEHGPAKKADDTPATLVKAADDTNAMPPPPAKKKADATTATTPKVADDTNATPPKAGTTPTTDKPETTTTTTDQPKAGTTTTGSKTPAAGEDKMTADEANKDKTPGECLIINLRFSCVLFSVRYIRKSKSNFFILYLITTAASYVEGFRQQTVWQCSAAGSWVIVDTYDTQRWRSSDG
jgi:hypothetical protein